MEGLDDTSALEFESASVRLVEEVISRGAKPETPSSGEEEIRKRITTRMSKLTQMYAASKDIPREEDTAEEEPD